MVAKWVQVGHPVAVPEPSCYVPRGLPERANSVHRDAAFQLFAPPLYDVDGRRSQLVLTLCDHQEAPIGGHVVAREDPLARGIAILEKDLWSSRFQSGQHLDGNSNHPVLPAVIELPSVVSPNGIDASVGRDLALHAKTGERPDEDLGVGNISNPPSIGRELGRVFPARTIGERLGPRILVPPGGGGARIWQQDPIR